MLTDALGYVAAGLVFATFCVQRMASLRLLAIASNLAFIGYGYLDSLWPILILHCAMLPINVLRYQQCMQKFNGRATTEAGRSVGITSAPVSETGQRQRIAAALALLRSWREHGDARRELSTLSARDFRALKVPPGLVSDELRRWPWQGPSPQWRTVGAKWSALNGDGPDDRIGRN
jgi:hypothetical protein